MEFKTDSGVILKMAPDFTVKAVSIEEDGSKVNINTKVMFKGKNLKACRDYMKRFNRSKEDVQNKVLAKLYLGVKEIAPKQAYNVIKARYHKVMVKNKTNDGWRSIGTFLEKSRAEKKLRILHKLGRKAYIELSASRYIKVPKGTNIGVYSIEDTSGTMKVKKAKRIMRNYNKIKG